MAKEGKLYFRVNKNDAKSFKKKCKSVGRSYSDVVCELISAFSEDRLKIIPTKEQKKQQEDLYID